MSRLFSPRSLRSLGLMSTFLLTNVGLSVNASSPDQGEQELRAVMGSPNTETEVVQTESKNLIISRQAGNGEHRSGKTQIKIIRLADESDNNPGDLKRQLSEAMSDSLPSDVTAAIERALADNLDQAQMDVDVFITEDEKPHVFLKGMALPEARGSDSRALRWRHKTGPAEPALSQAAAACVLKSITKVTTESGTHLLREACTAAFDNPEP